MTAGAQQVNEAVESISAVTQENSAATEEMAAQAEQVELAIQDIATVSQNRSAAINEISAGAEEMSAQVEQISPDDARMAETAALLRELVERFRLEAAEAEPAVLLPVENVRSSAAPPDPPLRRRGTAQRDGLVAPFGGVSARAASARSAAMVLSVWPTIVSTIPYSWASSALIQ